MGHVRCSTQECESTSAETVRNSQCNLSADVLVCDHIATAPMEYLPGKSSEGINECMKEIRNSANAGWRR
ncbi:hypothetical protein PISMIDRAFT_676952 [Pisolithus microcarpus 441]|uniref:Uncharacterized protein n=1 Tax=Pisolithus microcarpus 441 TaxID=765257 RepID=A0A0C9ZTS4_9AGAM|nr:hypothetical protein PISMIDRAFT_676952 [Pisolithus microcarpus 441]